MKTVVTSAESPIRVDWIIDSVAMRFGLTFCPGKRAPGITGVVWNRDLATDIADLKRLGVQVVAPLIPEAEMDQLGVPNLLEELRAAELEVEHHGFADGGVPGDMLAFAAFVDRIVERLTEGAQVVTHCRGGLGRAGLTAACVLLRLGRFQNASAAIAEVRRRRSPAAVETKAQERFVARYEEHLSMRCSSAAVEGVNHV